MPKHYEPKDYYYEQAKQGDWRARSVFKLQELQRRHWLIRRDDFVLDLGAAPGSFLQLASRIVTPGGLVVGVDIAKIKPFREKNIITIEADIFDEAKLTAEFKEMNIDKFDVIISDMAPNTTGLPDVDQTRSVELAAQALAIALKYLKKGGNLVTKVFEGADFVEFYQSAKKNFTRTEIEKPKSVRSRSRERYIVFLNKKL